MFSGRSLRPGERERDTVGKNEEEGGESISMRFTQVVTSIPDTN